VRWSTCNNTARNQRTMRYINIRWDTGSQCNTSRMYVVTKSNLGTRPLRRAADRRTRSSCPRTPRGRLTSRPKEERWSIRLVTNTRTRTTIASWRSSLRRTTTAVGLCPGDNRYKPFRHLSFRDRSDLNIRLFDLDWSNRHVVGTCTLTCTVSRVIGYCRFMKFYR